MRGGWIGWLPFITVCRVDICGWCLQTDVDGSGVINISELGDALAVVGLKLPAYEVRDLIRRCDSKIKDDCLDFEEFKVVIGYWFVSFLLKIELV